MQTPFGLEGNSFLNSVETKRIPFLLHIFALIGYACTAKDDLIFYKLVSSINFYDTLGKAVAMGEIQSNTNTH